MNTDFDDIKNCFTNGIWGLSCHIDLYNCNGSIIRDKEKIELFIINLCELIDMKRYGCPMIENFGHDPKIAGYSFMQLIETSSITGHFSDFKNNAYIDIFSCKPYDPDIAFEFCKDFFEADNGYKVMVKRL